ncbi:transporter [Bradyrhizobium sp. LA2.1]|uniref:SphA family protein n=2 Tax=Bradyrhizobium TaxID=374 RepID=UPI003392829F
MSVPNQANIPRRRALVATSNAHRLPHKGLPTRAEISCEIQDVAILPAFLLEKRYDSVIIDGIPMLCSLVISRPQKKVGGGDTHMGRTKMILRNASVTMLALALFVPTAAEAYELRYPGWALKPGITLGSGSAGTPPAGVYMFNQCSTYQAKLVGPTAPNVGGTPTEIHQAAAATGILFVPGWQFLGATYDAVIVQPFIEASATAPVNSSAAGMHNTYIVPVELSWKLGQSGFFAKAGFGITAPTGSISGPTGLANWGNPWWTFHPSFVVSYLKDGWNFTANMFAELNTRNTITDYRSGTVFHAEFTAAKTIGKWTFGAIGYYAGQVASDQSSAFYNNVINNGHTISGQLAVALATILDP